jgi:2-keto-4-pentenoate hydratase/2-oxohepta-3-ene-1,7-dioic acid hydratase in catechol pathway
MKPDIFCSMSKYYGKHLCIVYVRVRNKIMKLNKKLLLLVFIISITTIVYLLNRPISNPPKPANFICLNKEDGSFRDFDSIKHIYGFGLSYRQHIIQTAASYNPTDTPPVFKKSINSIITHENEMVSIPSNTALQNALNNIESGLSEKIIQKFSNIKPLVDYEVELGIIILEDITIENLKDSKFIPKLGFFIANDISERCIAILGDGESNKYDYWGISKDFEGFTPLPEKYWIPNQFKKDQIPCVTIKTFVNGKLRQKEKTSNMIYTPTQLLNYISSKYQTDFIKGDIILSGTPGGTAIHAPRWKIRMGKLIGADRFKKLQTVLNGDQSEYLKNKDEMVVSGDWLGERKVIMKLQ